MNSTDNDTMPAEIDFRKAVRGLHHMPADAKVFLPASIEKSVLEYFANRAAVKGVELSALLTDVLRRDIEITEALNQALRTVGLPAMAEGQISPSANRAALKNCVEGHHQRTR